MSAELKSSLANCRFQSDSSCRLSSMKTFFLLVALVNAVGAATLQGALYEKAKSIFASGLDELLSSNDVSVTVTGSKFVCKVGDDYDLRVLKLYQVLVPDFARSVTNVKFLDDVQSPLNFPVDSFSVDLSEGRYAFALTTRPWDRLEIVNDFLVVTGLTVDIAVSIDTTKPAKNRFSLDKFSVDGTWEVGTIGFNLHVAKDGSTYSISGSPSSGDVAVGSFFQSLGEDLLPSGPMKAALKKAGLDAFTLQDVKVEATYDKTAGDFAFCVSGMPSIAGWGGFRFHVLYHRYNRGERRAVTIGVDVKQFRLADLIKKISGTDISRVPLLGTLTIPDIGLLISTDDVKPNLLPTCVEGILREAAPFQKGVSIVAQFKLVPEATPIKFVIRITPDGVSLETLGSDRSGFSVRNVARAFGLNVDAIKLPPGINGILDIGVTRLSYSKSRGVFSISIALGRVIEIIPGWVSIDEAYVNVNATTQSPRRIQVDAHGRWSIGSTQFTVDVEPQANGKGYVICGGADVINIGQIVEKVGSTFFPSGIKIGFLESFRIVDPSICVTTGDLSISLSGEPRIGDWGGVTVNFVAKKTGTGFAAALGLDFAKTGFADVLKKITGLSIPGVPIFDQGLSLGVVLSSADFAGTTFQGPTLRQLGTIKRGLTIAGVLRLPPCGGDAICKFLKPVIGEGSLQIAATITSFTSFTVSAAIKNVKLGSAVTLQSAGLELVVSTSAPSIGIVCQLLINNPHILFEGAFRATAAGELQASMKMIGLWERAFGLNWLTFGNLLLSIKFIPGATITAFELGGELHLGNPGNQLKGAAYVGVDTTNPQNNYFYASINEVTIDKLLRMFGIRVSLPRVLRESGFPEGIETSFSALGKQVPGRFIPAGFKLKGTMNILGFVVKADIHVSPPQFIKIDIEMSPLNLAGGLFKMYASKSEPNRGPYLKVDMSVLPPKVDVKASGYVELFELVRVGGTLVINEKEYVMAVSGPFFSVFQANFRIHASFGSLKNAAFKVHGDLSTQWLEDLATKAKNLINRGAQEATKKISDAQATVNRAKAPLDNAQNKLRGAQSKVNSLCKIKSCSSSCIGCPKWNGCCKKIWGKCIGCPGWNGCCTRITNPICAAGNLACKGLRGAAYLALKVAEKAIDVAKAPFNAAIAVLEGVKRAVKVGADAASWIARNTLTGLINIKLISFDIDIHLVKGGSFSGKLIVSFLRRTPVTLSFHLRFASPLEMIKDLADRAFKGISGRRRRDVDKSLAAAFPGYTDRLFNPYKPGSYKSRSKRDVDDAVDDAMKKAEAEFNEMVESPANERRDIPPRDESSMDDVMMIGKKDMEEIESLMREENTNARPRIQPGSFDKTQAPNDMGNEPGSDESKCDHFKKFFGFLEEVAQGFQAVYSGLKEEVKPYYSQKKELAGCYEAMMESEKQGEEVEKEVIRDSADLKKMEEDADETMNELQGGQQRAARVARAFDEMNTVVQEGLKEKAEDMKTAKMLCKDVEELDAMSHDIMVEHNARGVGFVLEQINAATTETFQMSFSQLVTNHCRATQSWYENYAGDKREGAARVHSLITSICSHFGYQGEEFMGDKSVLKSREAVEIVLKKLVEAESIPVFCSK